MAISCQPGSKTVMHRVKRLPGPIAENDVMNVEAETVVFLYLDVNIKGYLTSEGQDGEQKQMRVFIYKSIKKNTRIHN